MLAIQAVKITKAAVQVVGDAADVTYLEGLVNKHNSVPLAERRQMICAGQITAESHLLQPDDRLLKDVIAALLSLPGDQIGLHFDRCDDSSGCRHDRHDLQHHRRSPIHQVDLDLTVASLPKRGRQQRIIVVWEDPVNPRLPVQRCDGMRHRLRNNPKTIVRANHQANVRAAEIGSDGQPALHALHQLNLIRFQTGSVGILVQRDERVFDDCHVIVTERPTAPLPSALD